MKATVLVDSERPKVSESEVASILKKLGIEHSVTSPSFGVVDLPQDTIDPAQALQLADERMYEQKNSGRASSRRQTRDVLLQVLSEREPDLNSHAGGVTAYAIALGRAVGRKMGLGGSPGDDGGAARGLSSAVRGGPRGNGSAA